jgi:RHS repeat-associated protein
MPFGEAMVTVNQLENPIRFPGQYYDGEMGTHYNYYRNYDPSLGRYIQSDPIGLEGGLNIYGHADGNPVNTIDPTGEFAIVIPFIPAIITGTDVAIGALIAAFATIPGDSARSKDRTTPWPDRRKDAWVCNCRADCNDNIIGNCPDENGNEFAFGTGMGKTKGEAKSNAKRDAQSKLQCQPKHTVSCKCASPSGQMVPG